MSIPLPKYAKIKDKYCIAYFGNCNDYLVQLRLLRPLMEKTYPGVQVYIAYRDNASHLFHNTDRTLTRSELEIHRDEFAYVRELICDMQSHPVYEFMRESNIPCGPVAALPHKKTGKCVLLTQGMLPTASLRPDEITDFRGLLLSEGCNLTIDGEIDDAEFVVGVESDKLFQAGADGARVALIPTGFGENLFKSMYPKGKIVKI